MSIEEYRLVVLGGGDVGKSSVTVQLVSNHFGTAYDPTIEDTYRKQVNVDGNPCLLDILDTAGQEEYSAMRELYMRSGQGFILIYSITSRQSFDEVSSVFRELIRKIRDEDEVPMVLCGNKCDLENMREVTKAEGESMSKLWGVPFFETSALARINVEESFDAVVREIRRRAPQQRQQRVIRHK